MVVGVLIGKNGNIVINPAETNEDSFRPGGEESEGCSKFIDNENVLVSGLAGMGDRFEDVNNVTGENWATAGHDEDMENHSSLPAFSNEEYLLSVQDGISVDDSTHICPVVT